MTLLTDDEHLARVRQLERDHAQACMREPRRRSTDRQQLTPITEEDIVRARVRQAQNYAPPAAVAPTVRQGVFAQARAFCTEVWNVVTGQTR